MRAVGLARVSDDDLAAWQGLRSLDPVYGSAFFAPGFAEVVHGANQSVTLVVGEDASGEPRLVWPLQHHGSTLRHVGWPAADFQGPVGSSSFDPRAILAAVGGRTLAFDHLVEGTPVLADRVQTWLPSPYLDVTGGLEGYLARASKSGRSNMGQARRKIVKAAERYGEMTFTVSTDSSALLDQVIDLKRRQYAETGARDYFGVPGRVEMLHRLIRRRDPDFAGVLSAVHFGDTLVAAHVGMRSGVRLHWWFPVYAPEASDLSPGWILLRALAAAADELGVTQIDLGRGSDEYKRRAMTGQVMVGQGLVSRSSFVRTQAALSRRVRSRVASTGLAPRVRRLARSGGRSWT
jgi:CelD/BcsL family acetyltransferase involved in cellulose biosynthesis